MRFIISLLLLLVAATTSASTPPPPPLTTIKGASCGGGGSISAAKESALLATAHATHQRVYVHWRYIEPTLDSLPNVTTYTVAYVRANPSVIDEWARSVSWAEMDGRVAAAVSAKLVPIIELGEGTVESLPTYNGEPVDPDRVSTSLYLALQYRYTRAATRRYRNITRLYQVENELNEAWLASVGGQRVFNASSSSGGGGAWRNMTFLEQLLETLVEAVKTEQPLALVTMNYHTDVPEAVHRNLSVPGCYYLDCVKAWQHLFDFISFDAYPNMYVASPVRGDLVGDRLAAIRRVLQRPQKPVIVMETGYPVSSVMDPPDAFAYTAARQAQFVTDAYRSVMANGGAGMMYFKMEHQPGMQAPSPSGYNADDVAAFTLLATVISTNATTPSVEAAVAWAISHLDYITSGRLAAVAAETSKGWGLLDEFYSPRPAYFALQAAFAS